MDSTPPRGVSATPANGTAGVSRTAPLSATFSEGVRASTVTSATLTLRSPLETVGGAVSLSGATATFTPTQTLTPGTTYSVRISTGVQDLAGNALAVWSQTDGTFSSIWANRFTVGTGWGTATPIETNHSGDANAPRITFDAGGNAIAVWQKADGPVNHIWANRYAAGSGPQSIWSNRYVVDSGWGTATWIQRLDFTWDAISPQITCDRNGNALAVWDQSTGSLYNIWVNRYTAGTGWGAAALMPTDLSLYGLSPQIAFDGRGNAQALWTQTDAMGGNSLVACPNK